MKLHKFEDDLYEKLRDPEFAIAYLEAAKEDGMDEFLFALREVASAQESGIKAVVRELATVNIYTDNFPTLPTPTKSIKINLSRAGVDWCPLFV